MPTDLVNLNKFRKAKAREGKEKRAEENRAKYGRSKVDRIKDKDEQVRRDALLDGAKREIEMREGVNDGGNGNKT